MGLGGHPAISLARAHRRASDNRAGVADGRNILAEKRRPAMPTYRKAALKVHEINRPRWRSAKQTRNWIQTLERHAMPTLADIPVDRIGRAEVLGVLTPIWTTRPETARRVRQRIRTVLWCMAHGFVEHNVAGEAIDDALPSMPQVKEHLGSLPYRKVAATRRTVEESRASLSARLCLRFVVLTAGRSGEARGATWKEFDLDAREWRILGGRMKAGAEHRVPLSDAAIAVLDGVRPLRDDSDLVFPSPAIRGRPLSDMTLTKISRATGLADRATVHGFRSSFRRVPVCVNPSPCPSRTASPQSLRCPSGCGQHAPDQHRPSEHIHYSTRTHATTNPDGRILSGGFANESRPSRISTVKESHLHRVVSLVAVRLL